MATDGTGAVMSAMLFDYRKVFDLIDHHLLADIILKLDTPLYRYLDQGGRQAYSFKNDKSKELSSLDFKSHKTPNAQA